MKLTCLLTLSIFCFTHYAAAQEKCAGAGIFPALLGVRLNMSPATVQSVFGRDLKVKFKTRDEKTIFQNYIDREAPPSLAGVRALYLRFFEQKLYQIEVFYEERSGIKTLQDFTASLSASRDFPASNWEYAEGKGIIDCGEFTVVADKILNPRLELTDRTLLARVEESRETKKKKK